MSLPYAASACLLTLRPALLDHGIAASRPRWLMSRKLGQSRRCPLVGQLISSDSSTSSVPPRASNTRGPNWAWIGQPQRPRDPISSSQGGRASKSQCPNPPFDYVLKQRTHRDPKPTRPQVLMRWAEPDLEISPEGNYGLVWPEDKGIGLCCSSRSSTSYRGQLQRPFVNVVEPSTDSTAHNDAGQPEWWENAQGVSGRGFGGGGYADSSADAQDHDQPSGDDPFLFQDTTYGPFGEHAGDAGSANAANENRHEADSIFSDPRLRDRFDASRRPSTGEVGAAPADQQKGARPAGRMPGRTRNAGTGGYQDSSRGGEGAEVSPDKGLFNIATENGWAGAGVQSDDEDRHSAASIISNPNVRRRFNQNTDPTSANRRGNSFLGDLDDVMTLSPSGDSTVDFGGRGQHASATSGSRHDAASIFSNPLAQQRFDGMSSRRQNSSIGSASRHSAASITSNPFHQAAYDTLRSRNRPRRSGYDAASDAGSSASNGLGILRGAGANSAKEPLNFLASTMPGQPGQPTLNPGGDANAYPPTDPYPPGPGWPAPPAVDPAVAPPSGPPELNGYPVAPFPSPPVHPMFMPQPGYGPPPANFGAPWALNGTTLGQPRFRDEVPCTCSIDPGNPVSCTPLDPFRADKGTAVLLQETGPADAQGDKVVQSQRPKRLGPRRLQTDAEGLCKEVRDRMYSYSTFSFVVKGYRLRSARLLWGYR